MTSNIFEHKFATHATLRVAYEQLNDSDFDHVLLAIDEFHHVSHNGYSIFRIIT